jgi:arsenate reductase
MGCGDDRPFIQGAKRQDWDLPDPIGKSIDFMRNVRDEIEKRVIDLINEL